ncbi:MAK10-like protein [Tanacetum coccineum]
MYGALLEKYIVSLELGKNRSEYIQSVAPEKMKDPGLFILPCRLRDSKPFDTLADVRSCVNLLPLKLFKELKVGLLEETDDVLELADGTKSYPVWIVKNVEVHVGKLKLFEDFHVVDMEREPTSPLLVGRGFLATANADNEPYWTTIGKFESYKPRTSDDGIGARPSYYAKRDFWNNHSPGEWEIARVTEVNPFKDVLVFRKMVEFLGAIPINLKGNMWESKDLIENLINWSRPPKEGDGAWHIRIELINPDGEKIDRAFQSILTCRFPINTSYHDSVKKLEKRRLFRERKKREN